MVAASLHSSCYLSPCGVDMWRADAYDGSDINIFGGHFACRVTSRGGFLRAGDHSSVSITGGVVENNVAERRAGGVKYVNNR